MEIDISTYFPSSLVTAISVDNRDLFVQNLDRANFLLSSLRIVDYESGREQLQIHAPIYVVRRYHGAPYQAKISMACFTQPRR